MMDYTGKLTLLINTTSQEMWLNELNVLEEEYILFKEEKERMFNSSKVHQKRKVKKGKGIITSVN